MKASPFFVYFPLVLGYFLEKTVMDWGKIAKEMADKYVKPYGNTGREVSWINSLNFETCGNMFKTREYQEELLFHLYSGKNVVIYKTRQAGYTTMFLLHMIYILNNEFAMFGGKCQSNFLYAAPNTQMCECAKQRAKQIIETTTLGNGRSLCQEVMKHISFVPFSRIDTLCGRVFDYEFYDEFAFSEKLTEFFNCAYPTMLRGESQDNDKISTHPPKGTAVFASSFSPENEYKSKMEITTLLRNVLDNTEFIETHWYEVPYYNKNLVWKKYQVEPTIDKEGNVRYDKERWKKMLDDGWIPTSPQYEKLTELFGQEKAESELLN